MRIQIRRWNGMHYVVARCAQKDCEVRWKSSYFQDRNEAEKYAAKVPKRGARARCLKHAVNL